MAAKTSIEFVDDIDGSPADHQDVRFSIDGVTYETDLTDDHYQQLKDALAKFTENARRVGGRAKLRSVKNGSTKAATNPDAAQIRAWADENGHSLNPRGRIPQAITNLYNEAQSAKPPQTPRRSRKAS